MANDNELLIKIAGDAKDFKDEVDKVKKQTKELEETLTKTAKASAAAFAVFAGSIAVATNAFADYEKALVGVGKTTNIEGDRLAKFGKEFQKLSQEIPVSTNELLGIAQAAGQLGVTGEGNLLKFTETVAKLGVATDLTGEQAATSLTRILNVTGESIDTIDNFGSVIVALGNNFAATESEIVKVATEVSRSTAVFDVSAAQAAGLATALRSVGVQAQLGGSAVGRAFREIDKSIREGGQSVENLSKITGIAADQLQQRFATDSVGVFQAFIEGLGEIQKQGGDTTAALEAFGLKGDEILKVLPVLAKNSEEVGRALGVAAKEAQNATALNAEAEKAFATLSAETQKTLNSFTTLATNIGAQLAPAAVELLQGIRGIVNAFSEADKGVIPLIASFLKWGAAISASVASVATLAVGLLKVRQILRGLTVAFKVGRVAALGFTGALTGGLSLIIGFLPEIISGISTLIGLIKEPTEPQTLEAINKELEKTKKLREDIANAPDVGFEKADARLAKLDEEIDKLEKLKEAKIKASEDFGTGELLVRPEADEAGLPTDPFNLGTQEIPFAPQTDEAIEESKDKAIQAARETEEARTEIIDQATRDRIDNARRTNEKLLELEQAKNDGFTDAELEVLAKRQELEDQVLEAKKIKNAEERALALENLKLAQAEELAQIEEFEALKAERDQIRREEKAALEEELRELDKEQQELFAEEDLEFLQAQLDSQQEAEKKAAQDTLKRRIAERNKFKQDEIKFGTEIATLKKFFNNEEVKGFKDTTSQLTQLSQSRNATLKGIGKAASSVQAAIATAEGAIKAYTSLAGIPIVGPALGAAAAAALIAFGVEQQGKIAAAQTGGFVPNAQGGARDRVPALLEPGELVVPTALAPNFVQSVGQPQSGDFGADDASAPSGVEGSGETVIRLEGPLLDNDTYVTGLAQKIKELQEFDNVRT